MIEYVWNAEVCHKSVNAVLRADPRGNSAMHHHESVLCLRERCHIHIFLLGPRWATAVHHIITYIQSLTLNADHHRSGLFFGFREFSAVSSNNIRDWEMNLGDYLRRHVQEKACQTYSFHSYSDFTHQRGKEIT
ncbi:hypothetical protein FIBSPDRAFT_497855 [Athelia psychrophila]|uniref:Uncharacterized protein n=1 Tax=Athelia psychrophila TaxID=1759441 RepID=A0A166KEX7_9AGAM|nr:hypothetical protein FIBSPDRAFT_497855 [Fibularhizoctonia sp. CBS 109695]